MNFPIPRITRATLTTATDAGCDCVMLKHCGFPISVNCAQGTGNVYADFRFGVEQKRELIESFTYIEPFNALLVGAKDPFTKDIHMTDLWWIDGKDLRAMTYRDRYYMMRLNLKGLDERFKLVLTYPLSRAHDLWQQVVADPVRYKGLVFRRSKDTSAGELFVCNYYAEAPGGLT